MRDCLIVLGMHRSGTSALAGAVHRLGVAVGSDLVDAQDDNVLGYYEHRGILELHENLLAARGSVWDDIAPRAWRAESLEPAVKVFQRALKDLLTAEFADAPLWAVKDPRLCHLLPVWMPVLADLDVTPRLLLAHRSAAEVADSLARRNGFSADKSNLLWVHHVVSADRVTRGCRRSFVDFGRLLEDPIRVLERAARQLEIEWPHAPADREESLGRFLDPSLRHSPAKPEVGAGEAPTAVVAALEAALAAATENPLDGADFDAVGARQRELGVPDALVVEHLHQFARRETKARVWAAKEPLQRELSAVSSRLGEGLAGVEEAASELRSAHSALAEELESHVRLAEDRRAGLDRTLGHLSEVAAHHESAAGNQNRQLADLRSRLDRLQDEVEVEARLGGLREDLDYLGGRLDHLVDRVEGVAAQVQDLASRRTWWQRVGDRLSFWRSPAARPDGSANS